MMKKNQLPYAIIGAGGQLASEFSTVLRARSIPFAEFDEKQCDVTSSGSIKRALASQPFAAVLNCSAYTAVDAAEEHKQKAFAINHVGVENLSGVCAEKGLLLVHFSTDYVFNGANAEGYCEADPADPQTVYGKSKLAGEKALQYSGVDYLLLRIAWLYGVDGNNFVKTITKLARNKAAANDVLAVVDDQIGTPTSCRAVVEQTLQLINASARGIFHATCQGKCSWYDFARLIIERQKIGVRLEPCDSSRYVRPAKRPACSVLHNHAARKLGLDIMPHYEVAFEQFFGDWKKRGYR